MKYNGKIEISGINTQDLPYLNEEEQRTLLLRTKEGDEKAREELIIGNLRLVLSIVGRFSARREDPEDLFQVGCMGLIKAIERFDPTLGLKLSTYAVALIEGEIKRYLRDGNMIRVSRSMRDLAYRALRERDKLLAKMERDPTVEEIATAIGEDAKSVGLAMEAIVEPVSLYDAVFSDGEDAVYVIDQLFDPDDNDDTWLEQLTLRESVSRLCERERHIIRERFYKGKTQMEIAAEIGISQAQVSRLEKSAIEHIRQAF